MVIVETVLAAYGSCLTVASLAATPGRHLASRYRMYDFSQCVAQVDRILTEEDGTEEARESQDE